MAGEGGAGPGTHFSRYGLEEETEQDDSNHSKMCHESMTNIDYQRGTGDLGSNTDTHT